MLNPNDEGESIRRRGYKRWLDGEDSLVTSKMDELMDNKPLKTSTT